MHELAWLACHRKGGNEMAANLLGAARARKNPWANAWLAAASVSQSLVVVLTEEKPSASLGVRIAWDAWWVEGMGGGDGGKWRWFEEDCRPSYSKNGAEGGTCVEGGVADMWCVGLQSLQMY